MFDRPITLYAIPEGQDEEILVFAFAVRVHDFVSLTAPDRAG
jgi:hypothetical protein